MEIKLLQEQDATRIRTAFMEKYLLKWPQYLKTYPDAKNRIFKNPSDFDHALMWDRMPSEYPRIPFRDALALLSKLPCKVLFFSEGPDYPASYSCEIQLEGQRFPHFAAAADARELAILIEYEWTESTRLATQACYLANQVLPVDLYVCTPELDKLIVFTHEADWDPENDDFIKESETRLCFASGFDQ